MHQADGKDFRAGRATPVTSRALARVLMGGVVYLSLASGALSAASAAVLGVLALVGIRKRRMEEKEGATIDV